LEVTKEVNDMRDWLGISVFFGGTFIFVAFMVAFDVWLAHHYGVEATITRRIRAVSREYPIIPFAMGLYWGGLVVGLGVHFWNF
jgi:hypothetical protein